MTPKPKRILDQLQDAVRLKHYSIRTEEAYLDWAKRFILFHDKRHPADMAGPEVESFLTHLAVDQNVAASTQNQALSAFLASCRSRKPWPSWPAFPAFINGWHSSSTAADCDFSSAPACA